MDPQWRKISNEQRRDACTHSSDARGRMSSPTVHVCTNRNSSASRILPLIEASRLVDVELPGSSGDAVNDVQCCLELLGTDTAETTVASGGIVKAVDVIGNVL